MNDFAVFILTHGRPNDVITYDTLLKCGYTGKIYIIIDNEDKKADQYYHKFGNKVIMFDKLAISKTFDEFDNFNDRRTIIYARNACFDIATELGYTYFIELDDDYTSFRYRFIKDRYITTGTVKNLDVYFEIILNFYKSINAKSISIAQGGDFIGGEGCHLISNYINGSRKCMNSFICSTDRLFKFSGRINEDVNTYTHYQSMGNLFLTIPHIALEQKQTQKTSGGMTDLYLNSGTYIKSFYTIICHPSAVCIRLMGFTNHRLHHSVDWPSCVPVIIDEKYKKVVNK